MIRLIHFAGWLVTGITQLSASPVSVGDDHDYAVMIAVSSLSRTAPSYKVEHRSGDIAESHGPQHHVVSSVADVQQQAKLSEGVITMEWIRNAIQAEPMTFGICGGALLISAAALVCVCVHGHEMRKGLTGRELDEALQDSVEVWEKVHSLSPQAVRLMRLFYELDESNQSSTSPKGYVTAMDLRYIMKDKRVAKHLAELGISTRDAWAVYRVLENSAECRRHGGVCLEDFVKACMSHDGMLMKLFSELDEANQSTESPPGYVTANDFHIFMQDERVMAEFRECGISVSDSWTLFRTLEAHSEGELRGMVGLEDFIRGCNKMS